MISFGGGQHSRRRPGNASRTSLLRHPHVTEYGFDGIDIDFESPSLSIDPVDTDKHPVTPGS
jgi:chitinase